MEITRERLTALWAEVKKAKRKVLYPREAETLLAAYGIAMVKGAFAENDLEEVIRRSEEIGLPVALKLVSRDILHKSDEGYVALNLADREEVARAYSEILENVGKRRPGVIIEGFLIQQMLKNGHEVIVGLANDPTFGKIILFGLGGIFVEILKDVAIRKIPITIADAQDMIEEIKGYKILLGARGREPANLHVLKEFLLGASRLGSEIEEVAEMDLNPVFVNSRNALVVDSRVLIHS